MRGLAPLVLLALLPCAAPLGCGAPSTLPTAAQLASSAPAEPSALVTGTLPAGAHLIRPEGHLGPVTCLGFSPDGHQIASGSDDRWLIVWDLASKRIVRRFKTQGSVGGCAFLPDGQRLLTAGERGEVLLWNVAKGEIVRSFKGLERVHAVHALAVRADGKEVIVGASNGRTMAWDVETGAVTFDRTELGTGRPDGIIYAVGYLEDGTRWSGGEQSGTVRIWNDPTPRRIGYPMTSGATLPGGRLVLGGAGEVMMVNVSDLGRKAVGLLEGRVMALAASPRGDRLVAGDMKGLARLYDVAAGTPLCELPRAQFYFKAAFDPSGERFAVSGADGAVQIFQTRDCAALQTLGTQQGRVFRVAAGASILLGDGTGRVSAWSPTDLRMQLSTAAHTAEVSALAALPEGGWVSAGGDLKIIASPPQRQVTTLPDAPLSMVVIPGTSQVLTANPFGILGLLPLDTGAPVNLLELGVGIEALSVRPGGREAVLGGLFPVVLRIALPNGKVLSEWPKAGRDPIAGVTRLTFSPDGARIAEGSATGDVALRNADTGAIERSFLPGSRDTISGLVFAKDHLWASSTDGKLVRFSLTGGDSPDLPPIDEGSEIHDLTATADGLRLIVALDDGRASVRSLPDGALVASLIPLRDGSFATVYADGHFVASKGDALAVRFMDPSAPAGSTLGERAGH